MLNKLKDILNTYTDEELKELDLWINSSYEVKQIIVDDYNIDLITNNIMQMLELTVQFLRRQISMLKIKDNVDLKELEKLGFKKRIDDEYVKVFENSLQGDIKIRITAERTVYPVIDLDFYNLGHSSEFKLHDTLYDLIKADLVEKVEDK